MFFDYFPTAYFEVDSKNKILVTDFLRIIKLDPILKNNPLMFDIYQAQDGETPEIISHKVYKSTQYHWVIMLLNEKFDPFNDFPQSDDLLIRLAEKKYTDINAIHHYEDVNRNRVDQFYVGGIPITNIEYEREENEKKRTVKVLNSQVLAEFVQQYKSLVSQ